VYTWATVVSFATDITLEGGPCDVFILQIAGTLSITGGAKVKLSGGVQAANVFWQVAGAISIGAGAHFEGKNILTPY
jgi:hypothetical protein